MQKNMNERSNHQKNRGRREGEVTIDYGSRQHNNPNHQNEGEYVDFEEVD